MHKSAHSEVLLTGWRSVTPDEYVITAQWPRAHSFYSPDAGHHDPLLLAESVRQAIPLLSHVAYDVPFGHRQTNSTHRAQLRADINHPILFDHPVDHAPGMLLLEAVRQAAYASAFPRRGVLTDMEMQFFRYAELNSPCWIETTALPDRTAAPDGRRLPVRVVARQNGEEVFTATAAITTMAPVPQRVFSAP
ncbi:AfsA-related hotdog domain-containing protein [Streptomyces sp. A0592]|uniref:AfsA-related hotdog domain-containing protein n=1 Tax=Streptomyces sp. A0592 TaxID=2563099 RepID=UPI001F0ED2ED|nr:AfsA-related hotdog domain-containing protein [Streptomyces sp. A0592]